MSGARDTSRDADHTDTGIAPVIDAPPPRKAVEEPWQPDEPERPRIWPLVATWTVVAALLLGAAAGAVGALNTQVYGPGAFVHSYLDHIADHDVAGALSMPGVQADADGGDPAADGSDGSASAVPAGLPADASRALLRSDLLGDLAGIEVTSVSEGTDGTASVSVSYSLDGVASESRYVLERSGTIAGVFPEWRFAVSPLSALSVTVERSTVFDVNGLSFDIRTTHPDASTQFATNSADYLVLTPAAYTLGHESRLLTASVSAIAATAPSTTISAAVAVMPNAQFQVEAQNAVDTFLDGCAEQEVLQPTSCPFGIEINDRLESTPIWTMTQYPPVAIGASESTWSMPASIGYARIEVDVRELFDGSLDTVDNSVSFTFACTFALGDDDALTMLPAA